MSDGRCDLTDLPRESCAHCRPNAEMERIVDEMTKIRPKPPYVPGRSLTGGVIRKRGLPVPATQRQLCVDCHLWIEMGDPILWSSSLDEWVHSEHLTL